MAVTAVLFVGACSSSPRTPGQPAEPGPEADDTPELLDGPALLHQAMDYFGPLHDGSTSMLAHVLDPALHAKDVELRWQVEAAIDHHQPIPELEQVGIHPAGNGTFNVDTTAFPEWQPLEERMSDLLSRAGFGLTARDLRARGFRPADVLALTAYLAGHPAPSAPSADAAPASAYTRNRQAAEQLRQWAVGVLGALDPQRQRVLESALMERMVVKALVPQPGQD